MISVIERTGAKMSAEQRSAIKLCARNGFSKAKTIEMLINAYGATAVKKTAVYKWFKRFKEEQEDLGMMSGADVR